MTMRAIRGIDDSVPQPGPAGVKQADVPIVHDWSGESPLVSFTMKNAVVKPPPAFFVLACCLIIAFVVGMATAGLALDTAAPSMAFGTRTAERGVTVVLRGRNLIKFSNGVEIRGMGLLPFWALFACVLGIVTLGSFVTLLKSAIFILEWANPKAAEELSEWWTSLWRKGRNSGVGKSEGK